MRRRVINRGLWSRRRTTRCRDFSLACCPDQTAATFVGDLRVGEEEFFFEDFQLLVTQSKLALERSVRQPSSAAQQLGDLVDDFIELHSQSSTGELRIRVASTL